MTTDGALFELQTWSHSILTSHSIYMSIFSMSYIILMNNYMCTCNCVCECVNSISNVYLYMCALIEERINYFIIKQLSFLSSPDVTVHLIML